MGLYYSRIRLDPTSPQTARTLACLYRLHQGVMAGFDAHPRGDGRVLFRYDATPHRVPTLLVQSSAEPHWEGALDRFFPGPTPEVKEREPVIVAGERYLFRLRANPTVKKKVEGRKNGRRAGIYGEDALRTWLEDKLGAAGGRLVGVSVVDEGLLRGRRAGQTIQFQSALFEGILLAEDAVQLRQAVEQGIGPAKGFGFGLLSLARG